MAIQNDQPWEGPVVEAPFMWKHGGQYYLFYSGNGYVTPEYAVGYAVSNCITGKSLLWHGCHDTKSSKNHAFQLCLKDALIFERCRHEARSHQAFQL